MTHGKNMWFLAEFWSKKQKNKKANSEGIRRKLRYFVGKKNVLKYTYTREEHVIIFGISKEKTVKKNANSEGIRRKLRHFTRKKHVLKYPYAKEEHAMLCRYFFG